METMSDRRTPEAEDREARRLVKDLHTPRPEIFWTDLLLSAAVGWSSLAVATAAKHFSWIAIAAIVVAVLALYRGVCFLHEITHLRQSALPGFETVWNFVLGVPMLIPSFMYVGVHQDHHKLSTYGTPQDPEYVPLAGRRLRITLLTLESFVVPALLMLRYVLIAPVSLLAPPVHRWLIERASSLCINPQYRREFTAALGKKVAQWEAVTMCAWYVLVALSVFHILPWRFFATWYVVSVLVALVNMIRTLGAHHYANEGEALDRDGQLSDTVDTPGALWTELWAPVGLRYHAMHHYFPGIPYHNLGEAYWRLIRVLPPDSVYSQASSPSLVHSLHTLYQGDYAHTENNHARTADA